mmetsp:Transcript_19956/g.41777  ORF Transcript_19956/g.41777 Transcript_19956/m.41777 type:complete len:213 (-) Transcript_19956:1823-2461(-)
MRRLKTHQTTGSFFDQGALSESITSVSPVVNLVATVFDTPIVSNDELVEGVALVCLINNSVCFVARCCSSLSSVILPDVLNLVATVLATPIAANELAGDVCLRNLSSISSLSFSSVSLISNQLSTRDASAFTSLASMSSLRLESFNSCSFLANCLVRCRFNANAAMRTMSREKARIMPTSPPMAIPEDATDLASLLRPDSRLTTRLVLDASW